ncbi:helix-turn-helix transcriptional regulator [Bacillus shivajii]|uniref:substrate-binding domain-containing protein n=1 Tax=Bacillus shivajii TaxID=1983719 RepID=UPI001CFA1A43|nr:helix-turn-helix transcriptional regulator [Bacillus shivajii]UCZ53501.1 helix-turn-helix transcriptional regulator [Bacillus shivajii]
MGDKIYTPEEIAQLLQISKHTVYELIKRKQLIAFKVGNKMRIEERELESFKNQQSTVNRDPLHSNEQSSLRLAGSHDLLLEKFCQDIHQNEQHPLRIQTSFIGSLEGCMALYRNECDVAAVHLFDRKSRTYNLPIIEQFFSSSPITVVHFTKRKQGFIVSRGNPKEITDWHSLAENNITFANRQKGSGTRQLLDFHLKEEQISPSSIVGYENEEWTHYMAATHILNGSADVTLGIEPVAHLLGLEFIPIVEESFDFIFKWTDENKDKLAQLQNTLQSNDESDVLHSISGYNTSDMGNTLYTNLSTIS